MSAREGKKASRCVPLSFVADIRSAPGTAARDFHHRHIDALIGNLQETHTPVLLSGLPGCARFGDTPSNPPQG
jgi:hypothetical protein